MPLWTKVRVSLKADKVMAIMGFEISAMKRIGEDTGTFSIIGHGETG